jgi:hypothetical protein
MAPRTASARRTKQDENACVNLPGKAAATVDVERERKALADRNADLENQLAAITNKLKEVELGKEQAESKSAALEQKLKQGKKKAGFTPSLEGAGALLAQAEPAKEGKTKDSNKPKHPQSSYLYFCASVREQVKADHPEADFTETNKILGAKWTALESTAREPFEAQAAAEKERYQAEMVKYNKVQNAAKEQQKALGMLQEKQEQEMARELLKQYQAFLKETEADAKPSGKSKDVDPDKPKRSLNAYMFFNADRRLQEQKKGGDKLAVSEFSKLVGEEWNQMAAAKKKKYEKMAEKDLGRYQAEMEVYTAKKAAEAEAAQAAATEKGAIDQAAAMKLLAEVKQTEDAKKLMKGIKKAEQEVRKHEREEKAARKAAREGMPKRAPSAYLLFCAERREATKAANPGAAMTEVQKLMAAEWKLVDADTKTRLQAQSDAAAAEYRVAVAAWREANGAEASSVMEDTVEDESEEVSSA